MKIVPYTGCQPCFSLFVRYDVFDPLYEGSIRFNVVQTEGSIWAECSEVTLPDEKSIEAYAIILQRMPGDYKKDDLPLRHTDEVLQSIIGQYLLADRSFKKVTEWQELLPKPFRTLG